MRARGRILNYKTLNRAEDYVETITLLRGDIVYDFRDELYTFPKLIHIHAHTQYRARAAICRSRDLGGCGKVPCFPSLSGLRIVFIASAVKLNCGLLQRQPA